MQQVVLLEPVPHKDIATAPDGDVLVLELKVQLFFGSDLYATGPEPNALWLRTPPVAVRTIVRCTKVAYRQAKVPVTPPEDCLLQCRVQGEWSYDGAHVTERGILRKALLLLGYTPAETRAVATYHQSTILPDPDTQVAVLHGWPRNQLILYMAKRNRTNDSAALCDLWDSSYHHTFESVEMQPGPLHGMATLMLLKARGLRSVKRRKTPLVELLQNLPYDTVTHEIGQLLRFWNESLLFSKENQ